MAIISEEGIAISKRFFEAIETLKAQKKYEGFKLSLETIICIVGM
ncbi:hypothetical protein NXV53_12875 [Bacteroides faecis]|nr:MULTISPECIES: hypothetical protein [Bacteroides]MCS2235518.1 hypothetical protein [Bacteroides faecis]MCS2296014.1 hypothetical protein [Bacteroides thetaiotaomicron]MCS3325463.1 hypothetical protein [Bacteroides faecis]